MSPWRQGAAYFDRGRFDLAERCYLQALRATGESGARGQLLFNLSYTAEQLHHLQEACEYSRQACDLTPDVSRLERLAWCQLMLAEVPAARRTLQALLSTVGELSDTQARLLLAAFVGRPVPTVKQALLNASCVRQSQALSFQLNRWLHPQPSPRPPAGVLHPISSSTRLLRLTLRPVLMAPFSARFRAMFQRALAELVAFHAEQFGGRVDLAPIHDIDMPLATHELFDSTDCARRLGVRAAPREVVVVGVGAQSGSGPLGFTVGQVAFISVARLAWCEALLTHEFYHAALDLEHTDGQSEVDDPRSVMAVPACPGPVSVVQRSACLTPSTAFRYGRRGERRLAVGDAAGAIVEFVMALHHDPNQRWVTVRLAEAWAWQNRLDYAVGVLTGYPGGWARRALAQHLLAAGRVRTARAALHPDTLAQQAWLWYDAGYYREALRGYRTDAARGYAQDGMARCLLKLGRWAQAEALVRRRLELCPWSPTLYGLLAEIMAAKGHRQEAQRALRAARSRCDRLSDVWEPEVAVYQLLGDWGRAVRCWQRRVRSAPVPRGPWLELGYARWQQGDVAAACQAFTQAMWADPPTCWRVSIAQAWVAWLSGRRPSRLPRVPYFIPALHLRAVLLNDEAALRRLQSLSPGTRLQVT